MPRQQSHDDDIEFYISSADEEEYDNCVNNSRRCPTAMAMAMAMLLSIPYILKADVLDVRTPQKIQIFRRKFVWERENYQSQSLKANNSAMCYK